MSQDQFPAGDGVFVLFRFASGDGGVKPFDFAFAISIAPTEFAVWLILSVGGSRVSPEGTEFNLTSGTVVEVATTKAIIRLLGRHRTATPRSGEAVTAAQCGG